MTVNILEFVTETQVLVNLADRLPHVAIVQRFTADWYISVELFLRSEELEHQPGHGHKNAVQTYSCEDVPVELAKFFSHGQTLAMKCQHASYVVLVRRGSISSLNARL